MNSDGDTSPWTLADNQILLYGGDIDGNIIGSTYVGRMDSGPSVSFVQVLCHL